MSGSCCGTCSDAAGISEPLSPLSPCVTRWSVADPFDAAPPPARGGSRAGAPFNPRAVRRCRVVRWQRPVTVDHRRFGRAPGGVDRERRLHGGRPRHRRPSHPPRLLGRAAASRVGDAGTRGRTRSGARQQRALPDGSTRFRFSTRTATTPIPTARRRRSTASSRRWSTPHARRDGGKPSTSFSGVPGSLPTVP